MIVREDDRRCVRKNGSFEHFPRVNKGGVERAAAHFVVTDNAVLRREAQDREHFGWLILQDSGKRQRALLRAIDSPSDAYG